MLLLFESRLTRVECAFGDFFLSLACACVMLAQNFFRHLGMASGLGGISVLHTKACIRELLGSSPSVFRRDLGTPYQGVYA